MKKYLGFLNVLLIVFTMTFITMAEKAKADDSASLKVTGTICTMEAKQCADGSYVSRTGPNCEFAECPNSGKQDNSGFLELPKLKDKLQADIKIKGEVKKDTKDQSETSQADIEIRMEQKQRENENVREQAKQKMEDLKNKIKDEKDAEKAKTEKDRINGRENALEKFDNAIQRITELKNKILEQIVKLGTKGVDVAKAKTFTASAEANLSDANTKITEAHVLLSLSIDELTAENKAKLVTLAQDIQNLIKESHLALIDAIKSLKDAVKIKIEANASIKANTSSTSATSETSGSVNQ